MTLATARRKRLDGITRPGGPGCGNPVPHGSTGVAQRVRLRVVGPDGKVKTTTPWSKNIACSYGLASIASMIGSSGAVTASGLVQAIRVGTGSTAAASTDTSLVASTGSISMGNASFTKTCSAAQVVEYQATFASNNPAGAAQIHEVGLFCQSSAEGSCVARYVLGTASVNKGASDVIQVSYQLSFKTG